MHAHIPLLPPVSRSSKPGLFDIGVRREGASSSGTTTTLSALKDIDDRLQAKEKSDAFPTDPRIKQMNLTAEERDRYEPLTKAAAAAVAVPLTVRVPAFCERPLARSLARPEWRG